MNRDEPLTPEERELARLLGRRAEQAPPAALDAAILAAARAAVDAPGTDVAASPAAPRKQRTGPRWPARACALLARRRGRGSNIGTRSVNRGTRRGQDGGVQCGRWCLLGATAEQPGQLAFFRRQRFVSVHAFNPARSLSIA